MTETDKPAATFLDTGRERFRTIALDWPVADGERIYRSISVRRMTAKQVADFIEALRAQTGESDFAIPIFCDENLELIPQRVMDGLDDDDRVMLEEAASDFLPRRFRGNNQSDLAPSTGAPTAP